MKETLKPTESRHRAESRAMREPHSNGFGAVPARKQIFV